MAQRVPLRDSAAPEIELSAVAIGASAADVHSANEPVSFEEDSSLVKDVNSSARELAVADGEDVLTRIGKKAYYGFCAQYFAVGIILGGVSATTYPVFLGYLNVPAYVYATISVVTTLPWNFKFFFGLVNDTVPIRGKRRKPYMVIGWALCAAVLLVMSTIPLPPPYWCVDPATGKYIKKAKLPNGKNEAAEPCHPQAAEQGGKYALLFMFAATGYVVADVAADGLTTEYARTEPVAKRGATQTTAYLVRTFGQTFATLFVGLLMNSKLYNGSFDWGLSLQQVTFFLAIPALIMVPVSACMVHEPSKVLADGKAHRQSCNEYFAMCWDLLKNKAFFYSLLFSFMTPVIGGVATTAGPQVKMNWAGVETLQDRMFSLVGQLLFTFGLWLVKTRYLNTSWRWILFSTTVFLTCLDSFFSTLTIFGVIRNQYFYLGETVLIEVPAAANFVVSSFVIVEMANDGNEGLVYGLMTTAQNLGYPFATAFSSQLFRLFRPALSDAKNYIEDTPSFRKAVFGSFLVSYGFTFLSMFLLPLLPNQKEDAQLRKQTWPKNAMYGYISVAMLTIALIYSLTVEFLSMFPSTMCLEFAGGDGCDLEEPKPTPFGPLGNGTNVTLWLT